MAQKYVVYVATPSEWPSPEVRRQLGQRLKLPADKLDTLLRRLPAEVTKPVPEATAQTVAGHFREAGLDASLRPAEVAPAAPPTVNTGPGIEQPEEPRSTYEDRPETQAEFRAKPEPEAGTREPQVEAPPAAPPSHSPREQTTGEDDWAGEFQRAKGKGSEPEEELLPESALSTEKQTKAPSLGLLVALVAVLAVLAALWFLL